MENFFSTPAGIVITVLLALIVVFMVLCVIFACRKWKQNQTQMADIVQGIKSLQDGAIETSDVLKETRNDLATITDEVHQNDANWVEHQRNMLLARHQLFTNDMQNRLGEMKREVELAGIRGMLSDKDVAVLVSQYDAAKSFVNTIVETMSKQ